MDDPKQPLPELFYFELQTQPQLEFHATFPVNGTSKTFACPIPPEAARDLVMQILSVQAVAAEVWPAVLQIFNQALAEQAAKEPVQ